MRAKIDFRLIAAVLLLAVAAAVHGWTIDGLAKRRVLRTELAEIGHVRYGLLNADRWVEKIVPVLDAQIDALDLTAAERRQPEAHRGERAQRPARTGAGADGAEASGGRRGRGRIRCRGAGHDRQHMVAALKPHVPEYADMVLRELSKPENKQAIREYMKTAVANGAKATFGDVDMTWYYSILKEHGCADGDGVPEQAGGRDRHARFESDA